MSKIKGFEVSVEKLTELLRGNASALASLLAAAKMDDDYKKNLLPKDFEGWNQIIDVEKIEGYEAAQLPPFVKASLMRVIRGSK
jgi:hypothetical protein